MMVNLNDPKYQIYNWPYLYFVEYEIASHIEALSEIIKKSEDYSLKLETQFRVSLEKDFTFQNMKDDPDRGSYYDHYYLELEESIAKISSIQRNSSLLMIYSLVEGLLNQICSEIEKEFGFPIKIRDLNSSNSLNQYWIFLTKIFGIKPSKIEKYFTTLTQNKFIRNSIAHSNSQIKKDNKFIKTIKGITLTEFNSYFEIRIENKEYIEKILKNTESFFLQLVRETNNRYKELH